MSDETKAPVQPGWVRLTLERGSSTNLRAASIEEYDDLQSTTWPNCQSSISMRSGDTYSVRESPAEVAALIAEAERQERRARALPVMAAELYGKGGMGGMGTEDAVTYAVAILDAIERREGRADA